MPEKIRHASWLELFYDLAFVAVVAQFSYAVADHHDSISGILTSTFIGYMIFVAWWGTTVSRNMQGTEDLKDKLLVQLQMVFAFFMSLALPEVYNGDPSQFFLAFVLIRIIQYYSMLRIYRLNPEEAPKTNNVLTGIGIAILLWIIAAFLPAPYLYIVAIAALSLDILAPLTHGRGNRVRLLHVGHLQERLGLFLLLVMGESMLVVALANTAVSVGLTRPILVVCGIVSMIALWWLYFSYLERCGDGRRPKNLFIYLHSHAFLFGSVVLMAAAYKNILKHQSFYSNDVALLVAGVILSIFTMVFVRKQLTPGIQNIVTAATVIAFGALIIAFFGYYFSSILLVVLGIAALLGSAALVDEFKRS